MSPTVSVLLLSRIVLFVLSIVLTYRVRHFYDKD